MRKLLIFLMLLLAAQAWGATYYVDPAGSGTTCSQAAPCATIQAVFDNKDLGGGDIIEVATGTYGQTTWGSNDGGSEGNPVILRAASGATPVIAGDRTVSSWTGPDGNGVYSATMAIGNIDMVTEDYIPLGAMASDATCADGNWFYDSDNYLDLYYKPTAGAAGDHVVAYLATVGELHGGLIVSGISHITIDGIMFNGGNCAILGAASAAMSGITIQNCTFNYSSNSAFFQANATHSIASVTIANNTVNYSRCGFKAYVDTAGGHSAYNAYSNTFNSCGSATYWATLTTDREAFGFQNLTDSNIYNNKIIGGNQIGVFIYTSASTSSGNKIYGNLFKDSVLEAIYFSGDGNYANDNNLVAANVISNAGTNAGDAIAVKLYNGASAAVANLFANNTIMGGGEVGGGYSVYINDDATYYTFKNNIISEPVNRAAYIPSHATVTFENNLWFKTGGLGGTSFVIALDGFKTWAEWQTAGYDSPVGYITDPLLNSTNYQIAGNSPAKNTAEVLWEYSAHPGDYYGKKCFGSACDIGAVEFVEFIYGLPGKVWSDTPKPCASTNAACYTQEVAEASIRIDTADNTRVDTSGNTRVTR